MDEDQHIGFEPNGRKSEHGEEGRVGERRRRRRRRAEGTSPPPRLSHSKPGQRVERRDEEYGVKEIKSGRGAPNRTDAEVVERGKETRGVGGLPSRKRTRGRPGDSL